MNYRHRKQITETYSNSRSLDLLATIEYSADQEPQTVKLHSEECASTVMMAIADLLAVADWLRERGKK